jgi:hypothetical protein
MYEMREACDSMEDFMRGNGDQLPEVFIPSYQVVINENGCFPSVKPRKRVPGTKVIEIEMRKDVVEQFYKNMLASLEAEKVFRKLRTILLQNTVKVADEFWREGSL